MRTTQLYFLLRKNQKLSDKRHPMTTQSKVGKVFAYIGFAVMGLYLAFLGIMIAWGLHGVHLSRLLMMMSFLLVLDFFIRMGSQQIPAITVRPYLLLPVRKTQVINCFMINILTSSYNLIWMFMFIPFLYISLCAGAGWNAVGVIAVCQLLVFVNSQLFLLTKTLSTKTIFAWLIPIAVFGSMAIPVILNPKSGFEHLLDFLGEWGCTPIAVITYAAVFVGLLLLNRKLQTRFVTTEVEAKEKELKTVTELSYFNRFGHVGEYLKLEIKSTMRNKTVRQAFITGVAVITMLSAVLAFTETYTSTFAINGWCLYCFAFFGATTLVKLMGAEGNYIDLLMVHRENIYDLLRAKYIFYCAVLAIPTVLLLPPVITGRFSPLMILAYLLTTTGPVYCILFQLAVYNKQTLSLNEKMMNKSNIENKTQLIVELLVFTVPVAFALILTALLSETTAYVVMIAVGVVFTLTSSRWIKNIYNRMMRRKYENLEGFHATR